MLFTNFVLTVKVALQIKVNCEGVDNIAFVLH